MQYAPCLLIWSAAEETGVSVVSTNETLYYMGQMVDSKTKCERLIRHEVTAFRYPAIGSAPFADC